MASPALPPSAMLRDVFLRMDMYPKWLYTYYILYTNEEEEKMDQNVPAAAWTHDF